MRREHTMFVFIVKFFLKNSGRFPTCARRITHASPKFCDASRTTYFLLFLCVRDVCTGLLDALRKDNDFRGFA